jgi:integrase/recombinase XerC
MYLSNFVDYLTSEKRYSKHTVVAYSNDITQFLNYFKTTYEEVDLNCASHQMVRSWMVHLLDEEKDTPKSVNRKLSSLRTYFKFLIKNNWVQKNPVLKITPPKVAKRLPVFVDEKSMQNLLVDSNSFTESFVGIRDKLIIELFYATGIRLTELINIKTKDVSFYNSQIKVLGKRNKERIIPVSPDMLKWIKEYNTQKKIAFQTNKNEYLFVKNDGDKMYEKFVYRKVKNYLSLASTIDKKSPHILRHTFATHLLNRGAELNAIKEILGHSSLAATQVYTHNSIEKLKNIHKQAHPKG